jgi:hypothetical protein
MFAVHFLWRRTAKGSDCHALSMVVHDKGKRLPCVFTYGARQKQKIVVRFFCQRTAKADTHRLVRAPSVAFLCRAPPRDARQRKFTVRCQKRHTTMEVYRANCHRVLFTVRLDEKRTTKALPCVFGPLHGKPPARSDVQVAH